MPAWSRIGFGTYRVVLGVPEHEAALKKALLNGVTVVDTSANYGDGQAEELIGKVLADLAGQVRRDDLTIVSKFGYIQGQNLQRYSQGLRAPDTVKYGPDCYHSVHPEFMRDQIGRSLERLKTEYLDVYLLHNPEYYLMAEVRTEKDRARAQKELLRRIGRAFEALEDEVSGGRIKAYGISSNSLSKPPGDLYFLPYEGLLELAKNAAAKAGHAAHSLSTLQLPANLLETEGLAGAAAWARSHGLSVLVNRPLNAFDDNGLWRLASAPAPKDYDTLLRQALGVLAGRPDAARFVRDMDAQKSAVPPLLHFESVLYGRIIPGLRDIAHGLENDGAGALQQFLGAFIQAVTHGAGERTRNYLRTKGYEPGDGPLADFALQWLLGHPQVNCVLLGMRRPEYVDEALRLLSFPGSQQ